MFRLQSWGSMASRLLFAAFLFTLIAPINALYFYLDSTAPKCFFEELPKDTLVQGHYKAEQYHTGTHQFAPNPDLKLAITVEETFDNDHRVVNQKGSSEGRFTFTAAESGDHRICFTPSHSTTGGGFFAGGQSIGMVKLSIDMAIGETSKIESTDKGKIDDITQSLRDLKSRLEDVKREQVFQREREAEFRDQSESTNSKVIWWTLIQLGVLGVTCAWQLSHLRAFFIKQKLN